VDPEGIKDVGVPDEIFTPTARFQSVTQFDMDYNAAGDFALLVRPDFNGQAYVSGTSPTLDVVELFGAAFAPVIINGFAPASEVPVVPITPYLAEHRADQSRGDCQRWSVGNIPSASELTLDLMRPVGFVDGRQVSVPYVSNDGHGPDAESVRGHSITYTAGQTEAYLSGTGFEGISSVPKIRYHLSNGTTVDSTFSMMFEHWYTPGADHDGCVWMAKSSSLAGTLGGSVYVTHISIVNDSVDEGHIFSLHVYVRNFKNDAEVYPHTVVDSPLAQTLKRDMTAYRCVSMSVLVTYYGNMLENDLIAVRCLTNSTDPFDASAGSLFEQGTLAEQPDSYSGPLQKGVYAIWAPASLAQATRFRASSGDIPSWHDESVIVVAGHASADAQKLRVRVVANYEALTNSRLYNPTPYISTHLNEMEEALRALALFPTVGENNTHLKKIAKFLERGTTNVLKSLYEHRNMFLPAISAMAGPDVALAAKVVSGLLPRG
jgi:hypothetical protein